MSILSLEMPPLYVRLKEPHRYKVLYGGRGGMKSWTVARTLLLEGMNKPLRILCARELQKSIKDSVHRLLRDQIKIMGLENYYEVQQTSIKGRNGTEFFFEGLRHNTAQIKSYEGADRCWIEEAATVSKSSWDVLIPTIRKEGSEIWITFNPELEEDETYQRFVVNPPQDSLVLKVNWSDNPWFPDVLRQEMVECKNRNEVDYQTIWEGRCRQTIEGAIYADELRTAQEDGRLTSVPYDLSRPVDTFWDLGYSDCTSIWFVQKVGLQYRIVDFYQSSFKKLPHYLEVLQQKQRANHYVEGVDYLPHDAQAEQLGTDKSIEETIRATGRRVEIVPKLSIADGINAARMVFNACWFDSVRCADGLQALRRYRYDVDDETGRVSKNPLHDSNSHAADAFRYFAVGYKDTEKAAEYKYPVYASATAWMGA